jgi:putative nucleotidyltransferase with HDIG domain
MDAHGMLPNIREHSFRVMAVAVTLGRALADAGFPLNLPLIEAGALLHDLGKTPCLGTPHNHALWGAEVLHELGYVELARVVAEHVYLEENHADPRPVREAEVVNYADKRVLHHRVVPLTVRFADLMERYGRTPAARVRIAATAARTRTLEQKLFAPLSLSPPDLLRANDQKWDHHPAPKGNRRAVP